MDEYPEEARLPKWAQRRLNQLRAELCAQQDELRRLSATSAVLSDREWFTITASQEDSRKLWFLNRDQPLAVCSLGPGDVLLVGRAKNRPV